MLKRIVLVFTLLFVGVPVGAQTPPAAPPSNAAEPDLQFNFDGAPWRDVIQWLAEDGGLALHVRDMPTGSFTYSDPRKYTNDQAIERVNLFLLGQGYTLVRSNQMLSVINLEDPRSMQQLDALARLVSKDELDKLSDYDVVKCIFPLQELKAEDAVAELSALKLLTEPAVFNKTNRILITDTVRKLKSVQAILDAFEPKTLNNGTLVRTFPLEHVSAEDVLVVARPHLGLATDEMIGIDVSISADLQGKNLIVTGVEDKVKLIEGLVESLDKPDEANLSDAGEAVLKTYPVAGGNVQTVYDVLVTLLARESVRLSMDKTAGTVVALASPRVHEEIQSTVDQLEADEAQFEVIPLQSVDPYFAITLIEQMLDLPGPYDTPAPSSDRRSRGRDDDDDQGPAIPPPKIDADPGNMRLFVRGRQSQIDQIKKIVEGLDRPTSAEANTDTLQVFPAKGQEAERLVKAAATFWRGPNPVIYYPAPAPGEAKSERVVADEAPSEQQQQQPESEVAAGLDTPTPQVLSGNLRGTAAPIRTQVASRGLLLQSEDAEALSKFVALLENVAGPGDTLAVNPIVFYLRYAKPDDAIRMLSEMLDGGEAAKTAESGTLVNGLVSGSSDTYLGSLVINRDGTTTLTAGTITVVAEPRLNRLIAQGTESDIELIEGYLKIIDKQKSITDIETYGKSHVIELQYAKAAEVADAIRQAFAGRVKEATPAGRGGRPGQRGPSRGQSNQPQPSRQNDERNDERNNNNNNNNDNRRNGGGAAPPKDLEPKITVAVHEASNSLIITAPDALFEEVEQLANKIDERNEIVVEVFSTKLPGVAAALEEVLGDAETARQRAASSSASRGNTDGAPRTAPQVRSNDDR